jgi:hypothetical protein
MGAVTRQKPLGVILCVVLLLSCCAGVLAAGLMAWTSLASWAVSLVVAATMFPANLAFGRWAARDTVVRDRT